MVWDGTTRVLVTLAALSLQILSGLENELLFINVSKELGD